MKKSLPTALGLAAILTVGCGSVETDAETGSLSETADTTATPPAIQATNAFYYYDDVERAWDFYTRVLGFQTVADYGFAKILQLAASSFLTLVDAEHGMHSATEPKSVTLALVTDEVEGWWEYLRGQDVGMRSAFNYREDQPHDGFVAIDPEGYLLEFERFNPHPENELLIPRLEALEAIYPEREGPQAAVATTRPPHLGVKATVLWLYYRDLDRIQAFYGEALGIQLMVDQGWAKVYPVSASGFLGFVDGERGLHKATEEKAVTVSFFAADVDEWYSRLQALGGMEFRSPGVVEEGDFVRAFVGYDPEGYFLEWDTFLGVESNRGLLPLLR